MTENEDKTAAKDLPEVKTYNGIITGIYGKKSDCIVHVLKTEKIERVEAAMNISKPYRLLNMPKYQEYFMYRRPEYTDYFRAYRLSSNQGLSNHLRIILIDTGEIIYTEYKRNNFFHMPDDVYNIPFLTNLCAVGKFPYIGKGITCSEFIKTAINNFYRLKFTVTSADEPIECIHIERNWEEYIHTADVEFVNEDDLLRAREDLKHLIMKGPVSLKPPRTLTYANKPIMLKNLNPNPGIPKMGEKIFVYPVTFMKSNLIFGSIRLVRTGLSANFPSDVCKALYIKRELNDKRLKFENLTAPPIKDEIVVASRLEIKLFESVEEPIFYRALVLDIDSCGNCELFFIDYGFHEKIHFEKLFKIPKAFSKIFNVNYRIKLSNIDEYTDEAKEVKALEIVKKEIGTFSVALVEEANSIDIKVKIFNHHGRPIDYFLKDI